MAGYFIHVPEDHACNKPGHIELLFFDKQAEATPKNSFLR